MSSSRSRLRLSRSAQRPRAGVWIDGLARVLLALVFVHALVGKFTNFAGVTEKIAATGLPLAPVLLVLAVGSALLILGWRQRLGAALLLLFLVPTSLIFHHDLGDPGERIQLLKNLAIVAGLLLVVNQPGERRRRLRD
ncbi:DoxX family membrane protein [Synechococcus sp. CS-1329]|uniref:DoxX family membrane protein n=1 Tax=Synechococcus sp. CS-1329 TaxID=2847975 RepID=UPI00223ABA15|nr:DoxX family membrane protein [Synechococcus sp. CS-1329]MCT0217418.1 DoxX family membrane protein [Synechococcus sp. CS-1329]